MGELFVGTLLHIVRLNEDPNKLMISMPGLDWELEGTQTVPMLNAAFERINEIPAGSDVGDGDADENSNHEYPKIIELLPHRERCFAHLLLLSMTAVLGANLGSHLVGIGFGIDEAMKDPLYTVLYWADEE